MGKISSSLKLSILLELSKLNDDLALQYGETPLCQRFTGKSWPSLFRTLTAGLAAASCVEVDESATQYGEMPLYRRLMGKFDFFQLGRRIWMCCCCGKIYLEHQISIRKLPRHVRSQYCIAVIGVPYYFLNT